MNRRHPLPPVLVTARHPATAAFLARVEAMRREIYDASDSAPVVAFEDEDGHLDDLEAVLASLIKSREDAIRVTETAATQTADDRVFRMLDALHANRLNDAGILVQHVLGDLSLADPADTTEYHLALSAVCEWLEDQIVGTANEKREN